MTLERIRPHGDLRSLEGDHASRYLWLAPHVSGLKVLDIGCGCGYGSAFLKETSSREVFGVDIDQGSIDFAKRHYRREGLRFERADILNEAPPARDFDAAVSFEVIEHIADPGPFLAYARDALKPGGEFFLSTPNRRFAQRFYKDGRPRNPFHLREYDPEELADILTRDFEILGVYVQADPYGRLAQWAQVDELVDQCRIPPSLRHIVPRPVKNLYLRFKGRLPREVRGRWSEHPIEPVSDPQSIDDQAPVQLYRLRRRMESIPSTPAR